jgi:uncharacterized membrane protein
MDTVPPATPVTPAPVASTEDKTVAIVAYLTLIGFIVAIVLHGQKKTKLGAFHLRQMLGLILASVGLWIAMAILAFIPVVNVIVGLSSIFIWLGFVVLWVFGFIAAVNGQFKPLPLLGEMFQKWFPTAFE